MLRTLDDCASLRAGLRAALAGFPGSGPSGSAAAGGGLPRPRVVVVGGGFVGCEVACTARSLGCDVTVVEPLGPPMLRVLGEPVAQAVQRAHEQAGITFVTGRAVAGYAGRHRVTGVVVTGPVSTGLTGTGPTGAGGAEPETVLPADLVVEAVGSLPNTEWLAGNGLDLTDGVLCDNTLSVVTAAPGAGPADAVLADTVLGRTRCWPTPCWPTPCRRPRSVTSPGSPTR